MKKFFRNILDFFKFNTPYQVAKIDDTVVKPIDQVESVEPAVFVKEIKPVWEAEDLETLTKTELDQIGVLPDLIKVDKVEKQPRLRNITEHTNATSVDSTKNTFIPKTKKMIEIEDSPLSEKAKQNIIKSSKALPKNKKSRKTDN